jgi:hypothetical protein
MSLDQQTAREMTPEAKAERKKALARERSRRYLAKPDKREKNRKANRENKHRLRTENPEQENEKLRQWRADNHERVLEYDAAYRAANADKVGEKNQKQKVRRHKKLDQQYCTNREVERELDRRIRAAMLRREVLTSGAVLESPCWFCDLQRLVEYVADHVPPPDDDYELPPVTHLSFIKETL